MVARGEVLDAAKRVREGKRPVTVTLNTGKVEWYSPSLVVDAARSVIGGFDLDPASSPEANESIGAGKIFTATDDGLEQDWPVGRIWMNPPYAAGLVSRFTSRFCEAMRGGSSGFVLVNNASETAWFQELMESCSAVCFFRGRLRFICPEKGDNGTPLQGQAIFYFGADVGKFNKKFREMGCVLVRAPDA